MMNIFNYYFWIVVLKNILYVPYLLRLESRLLSRPPLERIDPDAIVSISKESMYSKTQKKIFATY